MFETFWIRIDELVSLALCDQISVNALENELKLLHKTYSGVFDLIKNMGYGEKSPFHVMMENQKYNYAEIFLKNGFVSHSSFADILYTVYVPLNHNEDNLNIIKNMLRYVIKNNIQKKYIDDFFRNVCLNIPSPIFVFCCEEFNKSVIRYENQLMIFAEEFYTYLHMIRHQVLHQHLINLLENLAKNKTNIDENTIRILLVRSLEVKWFLTLRRMDKGTIPTINKICFFLAENYVINPYIGKITIIDTIAKIINEDDKLLSCVDYDVNGNIFTFKDYVLKCKNIIISRHHINEYMKLIIPFPILEVMEPQIDYKLSCL